MIGQSGSLNWLYIDINSYFATIEQQVNPDLRNKPIAVVPVMTDSASAIAASYEAKQKGIKTGTKIYEAKKLCPDLICVKSRNRLYVEYHRKIFEEIDKHLKVDHVFSIDEGACLLTGQYRNPENAVLIAKQIKLALENKVGDYIKCSIGIAPNRYLAKIASNMEKVDGLKIINQTDLPQILYDLELRDMPGIGSKTHQRLVKNGIRSVKDLCKLDLKEIGDKWGSVNGEKIWHLIRGADFPVEEVKKSTIGHSQVLSPDLRGIKEARNVLLSLILKASKRLRSKELFTNSILLTIDGVGRSLKDRIKIEPCCDDKSLINYIMKSFDRLALQNRISKLKKVSLSFHGLSLTPNQLSFDNFLVIKKQENLSRVIDDLNKKLGKEVVRTGLLSDTNSSKEIIAFGYVPKDS